MSLQPFPFSNKDANQIKWHELFILAETLATKFSLESQINCIINIFEQDLSCTANIWLDASFSDLVIHEGLENNRTLLSELSPLMEHAYQERYFVPNLQINSIDNYFPVKIAIPLMIEDEILGIIHLEKISHIGFTIQEVEFSLSLVFQFSLGLYQLRQKAHSRSLQQSSVQLTSIDEISKSILSNLDKDSLLNSVLSLIQQKYRFSKTRLYIVRGGEKKVLERIGITDDGLEPETLYTYEKEAGPVSFSISQLEPIVINDISLNDRFSPSSSENNIQSELVIPLLNGELLVGVLELCSDIVDRFDPDTIKAFYSLSQTIALAIRNANLYRSEHMRRMMYDRLQEVVGSISADISIDDVIKKLMNELAEILSWDAAAIWLIDSSANETGIGQFTSSLRLSAVQIKEQFSEETDQIHLIDNTAVFDKYIQNSVESNDLLSIYPWITENINSDSPIIRNSDSTYEPLGAILGLKSEYSALGAPLIINKQSIGMVVLVHHLSDQYNNESQSVANAFTNYASIAIENIRLYTAAHDQAWISTVLLQVAEATQSVTNIDELLETVVEMFPGLIGVDACAIFLWDQFIETFFPKASNGFDDEQTIRLDTWDIYPGSTIAFDQLKQSKMPVILNTETLSDEIATQVFPNYNFSKDLLILFPLTTQNSLCGAILIDFTNSTLEINSSQEVWDEKYSLIQGAARQTAVVIENLQLIKSQEEEAYISVALLQVAQAIVSFNQLDEILGSIVRITPILVGVKRCIIYLWDSKDLVFRQSELFGFSKNDLLIMGQVIKANEFPFIEIIQQSNQIIYHPLGLENSPINWNEIMPGETYIVEGISPDSEEAISIRLDSRSFINHERLLIGFPLSVKGEILGVMLIEEEDSIKGSPSLHIREKRIEIVKGITQQAAIAIKNELLQQEAVKSERMERELQLAKEIQTTFLPDRLPELPGWDIGARWQPARQVGGDFYDILILDDDRIGFVIADVADKGMPAALFMTLIRTLIRAAAKEKISPASVLKQVNELLIPDSKHGMFVTVFYGVIYLNSGMVVYANAGHNPPIVKQINQDALIELTRTSIALGIFKDIEVEERELFMKPGDWMLLYTDGITEAFSVKEEIFGTERLFNLIKEYQYISSDELLDRIVGSVNEFITGTDLSDDMTLATIFRKLP